MSKGDFFYDLTKSAQEPELEALLIQAGCHRVQERPLPKIYPGLVVDAQGLRMFSPGVKPQYWHPGMAHLRLKRKNDPLLDAILPERGHRILDCTLGMGHDALVVAQNGAHITALERCAPLALFTNQGIWHYRSDLSKRIHILKTDFRTVLTNTARNSFDAVYLDPMFAPSGKELRGFTWSMMRHLGLPKERYCVEDLQNGFEVSKSRLVLKLSPLEPPPLVPDLPKAVLIGSRRVKFAVWHK